MELKKSLFYLSLTASSKLIASGLASIGILGAGIGIGLVFGLLVVAQSINPSMKDDLFRTAIIGFALAEAMGLLSIMVTFLLLFGGF